MVSSSSGRKRRSSLRPERVWTTPQPGIIIADSSLRPLAFNHEAIEILSYMDQPSMLGKETPRIPDQILKQIRSEISPDAPVITHFRAGRREYICQASFMEFCDDCLPQRLLVLFLQRNSSVNEAVHRLAAQFNLTDRECEALQGISIGLSSKEIAERMQISPNTVKVYLRLVMVKMGVATRSAAVAKILEQCPPTVKLISAVPHF